MHFKCIICNETKCKIIKNQVRDSRNHKVVKCLSCGHIQLDPLPLIEEAEKYYDLDAQSKTVNKDLAIDSRKDKSMSDVIKRKKVLSRYINKTILFWK